MKLLVLDSAAGFAPRNLNVAARSSKLMQTETEITSSAVLLPVPQVHPGRCEVLSWWREKHRRRQAAALVLQRGVRPLC